MTPSGRMLLVDNQLPPALARHLDANGFPCLHVCDLGMADADDRSIWAYAKERNWVIVTKDEDFQDLSIRLGAPPQVVWMRLGNCRKQVLLQPSDRLMHTIVTALQLGESIVELRD